MIRLGRLPLAVIPVLLAACGEGPVDAGPELETWQLSPDPVVTIGGADERPDYLIERVAGATRLSDGTIVIADGGSAELRFYSPEGEHLTTAGGEGQGPGELKMPLDMVRLPGDTIVILSISPGLTWYSPEGEHLRQEPFSVWSVPSGDCRLGEGSWQLLPGDVSVLGVLWDNFGISGCPPRPDGVWRQSGLIVRYDWRSSRLDTLGLMPATERNGPGFRAYGRRLELATGAPGEVYAADTGADSILAFSLDPRTTRSIPVPFESRPVPASARTEKEFRVTRGDREFVWTFDYPDEYPRLSGLMVDSEDNLWVAAYPPRTSPRANAGGYVAEVEWAVLTPDGVPIASVRTPPGLRPLEIGSDYVLGLTADELQVQSVALYRLSRGGGDGS